jgi:alpha-N-acetylglucosamine transferase
MEKEKHKINNKYMKEEKYKLYIDDYFHTPITTDADISEYRRPYRTCDTFEEAVKACEEFCDQWCEDVFKNCKTESEFYAYLYHHGEDIWISSTPEGKERFSSMDYVAKKVKLHYNEIV